MHDHNRKSISDETLMRFVDGDLPPDERSDIAGEAARDPDLAQRLEAFRFTKEELAGAFAPALEAPPELIGKILRRTAPASRISRWNSLALSQWPALKRPNLRRHVMAIAAAVALLLAGAAGWMLRDSVRPDYAGLVAPPSLQRALEETPSDVSAKLPGDLSIRPTSTFASTSEALVQGIQCNLCQSLEATALACRGDDGIWRVETQEDPPARPSRKIRKRMYRRAKTRSRQEPAGQSRSPNTEIGSWVRTSLLKMRQS